MAVALLMTVWTRRAAPVRLFADRVEVKAAPLAPLKAVPLDRIEEFDASNPKKARLTYREGDRAQSVWIPTHLLSERDGRWLVDFLDQRAA